MNKTLLERQPNNKRIATTESLQKRFFNGSKNHVMEIEKLICHHSATKEHINFGYTILFLNYFYFSCHKYNPQIEMFARFKMKSSFHKTKRII